MPEKVIDKPDTEEEPGGRLMEVVTNLEDLLARERAKNQVLMERVLELEDAQADTDVESFGDVIPNESRDFWRGQLLENRCGAVKELTEMRKRAKKPLANAEPETPAASPDGAPPPAVPAAPAKVAPAPLHNRAAARPPAPSAFGAPPAPVQRDAATAAKLRNRAHAISQETGIGYQAAFRRAEQEAGA